MNPACTGKVIALTLILTLTGIQYIAEYKNCDLIVKSCDFHKAFKTDSPGYWKVESRTCFNGTLTLPSPSTPLFSFFSVTYSLTTNPHSLTHALTHLCQDQDGYDYVIKGQG